MESFNTGIKYGNTGIRTAVWSKMCALYGKELGTFIGLNMDIGVEIFNQSFVNHMENFKTQLQDYNKEEKVSETTDGIKLKVE